MRLHADLRVISAARSLTLERHCRLVLVVGEYVLEGPAAGGDEFALRLVRLDGVWAGPSDEASVPASRHVAGSDCVFRATDLRGPLRHNRLAALRLESVRHLQLVIQRRLVAYLPHIVVVDARLNVTIWVALNAMLVRHQVVLLQVVVHLRIHHHLLLVRAVVFQRTLRSLPVAIDYLLLRQRQLLLHIQAIRLHFGTASVPQI